MWRATRAPARAQAATIAGISWSVSPGITGATSTPTGTPAFESASIVASRRCGADERGSSTRWSAGSSVVTET